MLACGIEICDYWAMSRPYEAEQIVEVPSVEIARQVARLRRVDFAAGENRQTDGRTGSDYGSEDGRIAYEMAKEIDDAEDRFEHGSYELGVLYGLQTYPPIHAVGHLATRRLVTLLTETSQLRDGWQGGEDLQAVMTYDGYKKVGDVFVEPSDIAERIVPTIGAYAAVAFMRGDIKKPIDRVIYDRRREIKGLVKTLDAEVPVRTLTRKSSSVMPKSKFRPNPERFTITSSVFNSSWRKHQPAYGDTAWWWGELRTDLSAIDTAAEHL